ncbi:hypothetical protein ACVWXM_006961 [Bradyrhizobium sp. GM7.3]
MIAFACFLSIAFLLLLCGHRETFVLVVIAPVCVILIDLPLPRWTAPRLDISFDVYLYALPIQHPTSGLPLSFWGKVSSLSVIRSWQAASALLVEQPMLRIRKRIRPLTWLDYVWLAFRAIAKSERRFLSVFYRMQRNSGHGINSGEWAISAGPLRSNRASFRPCGGGGLKRSAKGTLIERRAANLPTPGATQSGLTTGHVRFCVDQHLGQLHDDPTREDRGSPRADVLLGELIQQEGPGPVG